MRRTRFHRPDRPGRRGRLALGLSGAALAIFLAATPALACGGLIGPNGAVNLLRTTTFAGYHDGVEHYVTAFQFAGGGGQFGSITPLPGIPTSVEKGGDWTLQRLVRETDPVPEADRALPAASLPRVFAQGALTNVLNPKVALFFLAFLPQFVDPATGDRLAAYLLLGTVFNTTGLIWNLIVAWSSAGIGRRMRGVPGRLRGLNRVAGAAFMALGVRLALSARAPE